jgi:hypothetical protein
MPTMTEFKTPAASAELSKVRFETTTCNKTSIHSHPSASSKNFCNARVIEKAEGPENPATCFCKKIL